MEANSKEKETSSSDERACLKRSECTKACQGELIKWGKGKFWFLFTIIPFVMGLVGFIGGKTLVSESVRETVNERLDIELRSIDRAIQRVEEAEAKTKEAGRVAEQRMAEAQKLAEKADNMAQRYAEAVNGLQQTSNIAQGELDNLRQKVRTVLEEYANLVGETGHVKELFANDVNSVSVRLAGLEEFVSKLARETTQANPDALLVAYEAEKKKAEQSAKEQKGQFEENSKYRLRVYFNERTKNLSEQAVSNLSKAGFKASSMNIVYAKERLWPAVTQIPSTQEETRQTLDLLSGDVITYTSDVNIQKVEEIVNMINMGSRGRNLKVLTWEFFSRQYGDPFLAQVSPNEFFKKSFIEIYIVKSD